MNEVRPQISVLAADQIERVHNFSLEILSTIGIRVDSTRAMGIFEKAGVKPAGDRIVRIPSEIVQWALKAAPSTVDIYNRIEDAKFQLGDPLTNDTRFGVGFCSTTHASCFLRENSQPIKSSTASVPSKLKCGVGCRRKRCGSCELR